MQRRKKWLLAITGLIALVFISGHISNAWWKFYGMFEHEDGAGSSKSVAVLTLFADPTGSEVRWGFFNFAFGHSFITVKNISGERIMVGEFGPIDPGKTVSIGTRRRVFEHNGLWYNLEPYFITNRRAYGNRVSYATFINERQLDALNAYIEKRDRWSYAVNCANFAAGAWNSAVPARDKIGLGAVQMPRMVFSEIKTKWPALYKEASAIPLDYKVYYANASGPPKESAVFIAR